MNEGQSQEEGLNIIDLFSGVGGLSMGFSMLSEIAQPVSCRLMIDSDPEARETVVRNDPRQRVLVADVFRVSSAQVREAAGLGPRDTVHVLVGGPPCQGFSWLGRRALDDERNAALLEFLRFVKELRPLAVVMENVPLIVTSHGGSIIREVCDGLSASGYASCADVVVASEYGVPQLRKRAIVIAYRGDVRVMPTLPPRTHERIPNASELRAQVERLRFESLKLPYVSVEEAIGDLPVLSEGGGSEVLPYPGLPRNAFQAWAREGSVAVFNHRSRVHSEAFLRKLSVIKEGSRNQELPAGIRFSDTYYSQAYARLHRAGIAQTVTTSFGNPGSGRFLHYGQLRAITVREAARFQTFPDRFVFHGVLQSQMRHVGNAVPVLLAKAIAGQVLGDLRACGALDEVKRRGRPRAIPANEMRSRIMRSVPSKNTSVELLLRKALSAAGVRGYRLHSKTAPGHPDLVFPTAKMAVFVDGCFWHGCKRCYRAPKTNVEYWKMKVERNRKRDRKIDSDCRSDGWQSVRVWEHVVLKTPKDAVRAVTQALTEAGRRRMRAVGAKALDIEISARRREP
jgi:DNA (cytosine-5)-methyltransferase 1